MDYDLFEANKNYHVPKAYDIYIPGYNDYFKRTFWQWAMRKPKIVKCRTKFVEHVTPQKMQQECVSRAYFHNDYVWLWSDDKEKAIKSKPGGLTHLDSGEIEYYGDDCSYEVPAIPIDSIGYKVWEASKKEPIAYRNWSSLDPRPLKPLAFSDKYESFGDVEIIKG